MGGTSASSNRRTISIEFQIDTILKWETMCSSLIQQKNNNIYFNLI